MRSIMWQLGLVLGFILAITFTTVSAADIATFKSSKYRFGFNYPKEWKREQPKLPGTIVKVTSPDGMLNFNAGAERDKTLRNVHPKVFVKYFSARQITETYDKEFSNFRLLQAGETTLCNQPAYYVVYTHIWKSMGTQLPWKNMTVMANRSGIQYTLTAGGHPDQFDKHRDLLMSIFASFVTDAPLTE